MQCYRCKSWPCGCADRCTLLVGDCLRVLRGLPAESVDCCVTSPPYWNLRDYGTEQQVGLEKTPYEYVDKMVEVFREVHRVLKTDGTLWINLGDSYAAHKGQRKATDAAGYKQISNQGSIQVGSRHAAGLKPKDLVGIPWRVAFALQADGWWLRGDHVWAKPNGMPESVLDRPSRSHEYVFLLTKSARYFYNSDAVRTAPKASTITRLAQDVESQQGSSRANGGGKTNGSMKAVRKSDKQRGHTRRHAGFNDRWDAMEKSEQQENGANLRSVWWIPPAQCRESHFAVMPPRVSQICILAGCRDGGVVLDPFAGSGTTLEVARLQHCAAIGIELNPEYADLIVKKLGRQMVLPL